MTITASAAELDGTTDSDVPAGQPYWQDRPCPPWCEHPGGHRDSDFPGDRAHFSSEARVTLTLEDPQIYPPPGAAGEPEVYPCELTAYLQQGDREREAKISICRDVWHDMDLTLAEARELAESLHDLVRQAAAQA